MNPKLIIVVIGSLLVFYFLGAAVSRLFRFTEPVEHFFKAFSRIILGFITVITVYALLMTQGNTIHTGIILLAIWAFVIDYRNRKKYTGEKIKSSFFDKTQLAPLLFVIATGLSFFSIQSLLFYNTPINNFPHGDFTFYSMVVEYMNLNGSESTTLAMDTLYSGVLSPTPYHYSELWLASLITKISGSLALETLVVAVHSIVAAILSLGMLALARFFTRSLFLQLVSVMGMFFSGILIINFLPQADSFVFANAYNPKTITVSIFFVWFALLALHNYKSFYIPLLLLPIINISLAPVTFASLSLLAVYQFFRHKKHRSQTIAMFVTTLLTAAFFAGFYMLQSGKSAGGGFQIEDIITGLKIDPLKPAKIIGGAIVIVFAIYIPYFIFPLILFAGKKRKEFAERIKATENILVYGFISVIAGLAIWGMSHPISDSIQFFYMPVIFLLNVFVVVLALISAETINQLSKPVRLLYSAYLTILVVISVVLFTKSPFYKYRPVTETFGAQYVEAVVKQLSKTENPVKAIAFITPPEKLKGFWSAIGNNGAATYLKFYFPCYNTVSLNALSTPLDKYDAITKMRIKNILKNTAFYKYAVSKSYPITQTQPDSISRLQYNFICDKKIRFLIIENGAEIPQIFNPATDTIIKDPVSGQQFLFLNPIHLPEMTKTSNSESTPVN